MTYRCHSCGTDTLTYSILDIRTKTCHFFPMIISVANSKGGTGKSTLAAHLTVWLAEQGYTVILADCDAQKSSSEWLRKVAPQIKAVPLADSREILNEIPLMAKEADFVIADGPGSASTDTTLALMSLADIALIPCKASILEVWALAEVTEVLHHAQRIRKGPPKGMLILSMVEDRYRLAKQMREAAKQRKLLVAKRMLTLRQAYADAPGQGNVVWRMKKARGSLDATKEIRALFAEIMKLTRDSMPKQNPRKQRNKTKTTKANKRRKRQ